MSAHYTMTVSPDFSPKFIPGWYIFNTWLQKQLGVSIHLELFDSFNAQRQAIEDNRIDLIYANPFDAAMLVREKGFQTVASPAQMSDEAVIAVHRDSPIESVEAFNKPLSVAYTNDPVVNLISAIMLEPADITTDDLQLIQAKSYVLVAKQILQKNVEAGFFLKTAFDEFSSIIRDQLRVLIGSEIHVIRHALLSGPRCAERFDALLASLLGMADDEKGRATLQSIDMQGWQRMTQEDTEYMIDLMDALQN
ncbi:MAG: phosphate/phosphite/phosphonate ABC transporter substrate-binding protein [Gammaproteobacteria bacterium]|nr:phosphate/phosphite/phosphonate ABC transporter substrate-binding protein [Gammaproteobacteria bacterium]